ncbi:MAG: UbiA family prenyltransferase [Planctomycetota bacterium]|nr:UbiA family prenyltransferase [Planctomycetota bacterium]
MRHWLRLARVPFAPTACLDALACGLLALEMASWPFESGSFGVEAILRVVLGSTALYIAGMVSNDWADRERDREIAPNRPIPCGAISPRAALTFALVSAFVGLVVLGTFFGWYAPAAAIVFMALYNGGCKRHLVWGAITMGGVRVANASVVVQSLVIGDFAPAWVLLAPLCIGVYSAAITVMSTTEDVDRPGRQWAARVISAVAFGGAAGLAWFASGNPWPTLGSLIAFGVVSSTLFGRTPRAGPPKRMVLEMLLGLYFLEYVIASAAYEGHWIVGVGGLVAALLMIYLSRLMIRALFVVRAPADEPAS